MGLIAALGIAMALVPSGCLAYTHDDSVAITVNVSNAVSVNIENTAFELTGSHALNDDFVVAQGEAISIDNDSGSGAAGIVETYSLSATIDAAGAEWDTIATGGSPSENTVAVLAVFSGDGTAAPDSAEFNAADDYLTNSARAASTSVYYGPTSDAAQDGLSVAPEANRERNLWLRVRMPTSSTAAKTSFVITLYISASAG